MAYQTGTAAGGSQLTWFDRTGKQIGILGDPAVYGDVELSPDGKRASVSIPDQAGKGRNIWLYDVARGLKTRFTFDPAIDAQSIWSPDGSRVVFNSNRKGHFDLYQNASGGSGTEEVLLEDNLDKYPESWSPDGRFILYFDLRWPDRQRFVCLAAFRRSQAGSVSQDAVQRVYARILSRRPLGRLSLKRVRQSEIYVAPFPGPGGKWQISTGGGTYPRWRRDGTEIFYLAPDNKLMAATVNGKGSSFEVGTVKPLFETRIVTGIRYPYDVSADGQRFLINHAPGQAASPPSRSSSTGRRD